MVNVDSVILVSVFECENVKIINSFGQKPSIGSRSLIEILHVFTNQQKSFIYDVMSLQTSHTLIKPK